MVGGKKIMAFPVTGKFAVSQADEVLTAAYGQIVFKQKVRQITVVNDGAPGDSDVIVSFNGEDVNMIVHPGDSCSTGPLLDAWFYDIWIKSSAAVNIPDYMVLSSEK